MLTVILVALLFTLFRNNFKRHYVRQFVLAVGLSYAAHEFQNAKCKIDIMEESLDDKAL